MTTMDAGAVPIGESYPVSFEIEPQLTDRNRVTVLFRWFLTIPHAIIVGAPSFLAVAIEWLLRDSDASGGPAYWGVLGIAAFIAAIIAWFAIIFSGKHPPGIWDFGYMYMRWRTRALAYAFLLRDEYPPFGDGDYPALIGTTPPEGERNRVTVGFRIFMAIPHAIVLFFLLIALIVVTIIAWFAILITGAYPEGLYKFATGVLRWEVRVESYLLLLRDEYPPFSLDP